VSASEFFQRLHICNGQSEGSLPARFLSPQFLPLERILALTNFFNLSNIHPVSRRSSGMVRTSQCFRTKISQLDGPSTLAAAAVFPYTLVLPASLVTPDHGVRPLCAALQKWHFLVAGVCSGSVKPCQFVCSAVRRQCASLLRPLQGFGELRSEVARESKFQATHPREDFGGAVRDRQRSSGARHPGGTAWRRKRPNR
jgi:hypothetical protein